MVLRGPPGAADQTQVGCVQAPSLLSDRSGPSFKPFLTHRSGFSSGSENSPGPSFLCQVSSEADEWGALCAPSTPIQTSSLLPQQLSRSD